MQDQNDNFTNELPLTPPAVAPTEAPPIKTSRKSTPRAKYTDSFVLKCRAGKADDSPSVMLLTALRGCAVPHKAIDEVYALPEGTVQQYLLTGSNNELFDDNKAFAVFDMLAALMHASAFGTSGLGVIGVLKAMHSYKNADDAAS